MRRPTALVVDDVVDMAQTIANDLERKGFEATVALDGARAVSWVATEPVDVVITDLRLKGGDGLEVLHRVKEIDPAIPVIIMTAFGAIETAVEAMKQGAFSYIAKPFQLDDLHQIVASACRELLLSDENVALRAAVGETHCTRRLLGNSNVMRQLRGLVEKVAGSSAPVLVSGETGTGKELVSQAIHQDGPRAQGPFVAINCAALPEHILESELFGHARGAFTGATTVRKGLFAEANGGTIFLDEIGDMSLTLQAKLLRVLQSGEVRSVGSEAVRHVDVRCIAASHKDLASLVQQGLFRQDLYFRLDVLRVAVPPLRDRTEDIPLLIETFLARRQAAEKNTRLVGFSPDALDFLCAYSWPGNVRQLENLVERLSVIASSPLATAEETRAAIGPIAERDPFALVLKDPLPLAELSARYIDGVIAKVGGNKARAAEILGMDPSTLYRRFRQPS